MGWIPSLLFPQGTPKEITGNMLKNFHYIFEVLLTANGQVHMFILACQSEKEMWD